MIQIQQQDEKQLEKSTIDISVVSNNLVSMHYGSFNDTDEVIIDAFGINEKINIGSIEKINNEIKDILLLRDSTDSYIDCVQKVVSSHFPHHKQNVLPIYDRRITSETLQQAYIMNSPYYVEMAMVAQNCLDHCGMKPIFKKGIVTLNIRNVSIKFIHAYNLFVNEGKYYIFDSTFPVINSLDRGFECRVCEISEEIYQDMKDPYGITYGVALKHPEFLDIIPSYEMIYDAYKEKIVEPMYGSIEKV